MTDATELGRAILTGLGGLLLGMTLVVASRHFVAWRQGSGHLIPLHVWTIAASYSCLLILMLTRAGPLGWRGWLQIPATLLGIWAMVALLRHQSRR